MIKICFVCTGNTCRSVMAERLCKKELKNKNSSLKLSSRGLMATGENITENAKFALKGLGASGANRKSVKLSKVDKKTLYVVMSQLHLEAIKSLEPHAKVISFKDLIGEDIYDPYGQDLTVYKRTAKQLEQGVRVLLDKILRMESKV